MQRMFDEQNKILETVEAAITWHADVVEDCTCSDLLYEGVCWYYLTDKEQKIKRINHVISQLKELIEDAN